MDCGNAQERILESLSEIPHTPPSALEAHLAGCEACRDFQKTHLMLDFQLSSAICPPVPSEAFRATLAERLRRERHSDWPEYLPDVALLTGCLCAIALCVVLLPFAAGQVVLGGLAFTLASYFAQSVLQSSLEAWGED